MGLKQNEGRTKEGRVYVNEDWIRRNKATAKSLGSHILKLRIGDMSIHFSDTHVRLDNYRPHHSFPMSYNIDPVEFEKAFEEWVSRCERDK